MNVPGICNMKVYGGEIEVQGEIEIGTDDNTIKMNKVRGYFMHKHNRFNLFYSE